MRGATTGVSCCRCPRHGFQPTRPLRGATSPCTRYSAIRTFQPTRPLRGATMSFLLTYQYIAISTHAPLAGRDSAVFSYLGSGLYFNPRAPCGARRRPYMRRAEAEAFQPTRPLRGATACVAERWIAAQNFNPRATCGARRKIIRGLQGGGNFNPRAPCGARLAHFC